MFAGWWTRLRRSRTDDRRDDGRWVVLDVETTGLDPDRDRVLAIGAVAVHHRGDPARAPRIVLADSLELRVAQREPGSRENMLVHGIGERAQQQGLDPAQALERLFDYVGDSPLVAFHAAFDRGFVQREVKRCGRARAVLDWVDVAELARVVHPDVKAQALDDWLARFDLTVTARHDACADALVTAMLFVRLMSALPTGQRNLASVKRLCDQARWLPRA